LTKSFFYFFAYWLQQKYVFTFRKDKNQGISLGLLCPFMLFFFFVILSSWRAFWYFSFGEIYFYLKKMLKHDKDVLTCGCRSYFLGGACNIIWWPNLPFHCVFRCSTVFSFLWGNKWQWMMCSLSLTIVFFPFFFSLFFRKKWTSILFSLGFSISIPMFFIVFFSSLVFL
jgi:hypothetical protein